MEYEYCVDKWAEPPEGIPTWCATGDVTWELGLQLLVELFIIFIGIWMVRHYYLARRRREREKLNTEDLSKSSTHSLSWPPSFSSQEKAE